MRHYLFKILCISLFCLNAWPVLAQSQTETTQKEYTSEPHLRLRILDKVRAISRTYDLDIDHTVAYANLRIRPRTCQKSSPLDAPENAAFIQIWEIDADKKSNWVFSGWMFSSTPSLSAMNHPVYDVSVIECRDPKSTTTAQPANEPPLNEYIATENPKESPAKAQ
jgi:hypothetical protein